MHFGSVNVMSVCLCSLVTSFVSTDSESSDNRDEIWEIDWRDAVKPIKSSDAANQQLTQMRDKMEATRLLNSRLQIPNQLTYFTPETIEKGTQRCKEELGLYADDVSPAGPTKSEGREMLRRLLPNMVDETTHEKDNKSRMWQWELIHQVTASASDRELHGESAAQGRFQKLRMGVERQRSKCSGTQSNSKKAKQADKKAKKSDKKAKKSDKKAKRSDKKAKEADEKAEKADEKAEEVS